MPCPEADAFENGPAASLSPALRRRYPRRLYWDAGGEGAAELLGRRPREAFEFQQRGARVRARDRCVFPCFISESLVEIPEYITMY